MDTLYTITLLILFCGYVYSDCPLSDPDCHPLCIEYVGECKYCRCKGGGSGFGSSGSKSSFGSSNFEENANSWNGNMQEKEETGNTKVIIVHEKETEHGMAMPGIPMGGQVPFGMPHGPMTFQSPFQQTSPVRTTYGSKSLNVPLTSPGIPKYCVSIQKMEFEGCSCTVVDENGCLSCPCYPASRFWIPVKQKNTKEKPKPEKKECVGTMLCMMTCKTGYQLGETGPDGCQSCTCLKQDEKEKEQEKPKPETREKSCLKLYECILKCSNNNQGFTVGEETRDGCRSCHCEDGAKTSNSGGTNNGGGKTNNSGGTNNGGGKTNDSSGTNNSGGSMMSMFSGSGNGNNFLKSPDQGVGEGSKAKCNPPMVMCTNDGNNMMQTMPGGSGSSGGMSTGNGNGSGSGTGMASPFNPSSGGSGSGGGMGSPFSTSAGGSGSGAGMKSTFGGGGGGPGMGAGGPGMGAGGPGVGAMGPHGPPNPGFPTQKIVEETAYNENCFGPSCSAKDGGVIEGNLGTELMIGDFRK